MQTTLYEQLLLCGKQDNNELLGRFLAYVEDRQLTLYDAQETAILELYEDKNVILNTPTGSGKSLVALAVHFKALAQGKRSVYTCPVKALVNEKWLSLCREFGPDNVGLCTGDASVNRDAPILCCTAEILANIALREGALANVQDVVMDEFHYYADRERGVAWQVPLLTLPQARFLLMSATLGDTAFFEAELTRLTKRPTVSVVSSDRPVPLVFSYAITTLAATVESLVAQGKSPVYVVHFTQLEAAQNAQNFTSIDVCTREEKEALAHALTGFKFNSPYGPDIKRWLRQGIGVHHAGLLPKYRVLVEQLAQKGLLKIICGTDTLGVGINVPIRTVLLTRLCKYDGQKTGFLTARDFHQISGRAGRKGFDDCGWVVAQAPEHTIENSQREQKRALSGKKFVKRKPPEKNFVNWDIHTFNRLVAARPEQLTSRFQVSHGMLLNVLSRDSNGCAAMRDLIATCHETPKQKQLHITRAWQLFRSLVNRHIVEFITPTPGGARLRVNLDLQDDFSMDQILSLYLLETIPLLDPQLPEYPYRLLTLIESILEDPDIILRKQLDKLKTQKMAEMKMDGVPFEERIEELDKLEYPKPDRDFIYSTFNDFADRHPWVGQENIRPKSIVREMFETYSAFGDYIRTYDLHRAEGVLLRHINGVFKVLVQTVPPAAKNDTIEEMEAYLGTMIRQVDSSLLDEWEKMRDPGYLSADTKEVRPPGAEAFDRDITRDTKKFTALVRSRIFAFIAALIKNDFEAALDSVNEDRPSSLPEEDGVSQSDSAIPDDTSWTTERLHQRLEAFLSEHSGIRLDPEARNIRHTYVTPSPDKKLWKVSQMLVDPDGTNDWVLEFEVDLVKSRDTGGPILRLNNFGSLV
jgi:superfamily II DNA/RNA helicase